MLTCPMCKKAVPEVDRQCARCGTDLALLTDFVSNLHDGVARADELTRAGRLGEAVWAYLAVLEVDPENAEARRQVAQVATAVRVFDAARAAHGKPRFGPKFWLAVAGIALLALGLLAGVFCGGYAAGRVTNSAEQAVEH